LSFFLVGKKKKASPGGRGKDEDERGAQGGGAASAGRRDSLRRPPNHPDEGEKRLVLSFSKRVGEKRNDTHNIPEKTRGDGAGNSYRA